MEAVEQLAISHITLAPSDAGQGRAHRMMREALEAAEASCRCVLCTNLLPMHLPGMRFGQMEHCSLIVCSIEWTLQQERHNLFDGRVLDFELKLSELHTPTKMR